MEWRFWRRLTKDGLDYGDEHKVSNSRYNPIFYNCFEAGVGS